DGARCCGCRPSQVLRQYRSGSVVPDADRRSGRAGHGPRGHRRRDPEAHCDGRAGFRWSHRGDGQGAGHRQLYGIDVREPADDQTTEAPRAGHSGARIRPHADRDRLGRVVTRLARLGVIVALCAGLGLVMPGSAGAAPGPAQAPEWWFDAWNVPAIWAAGARGQGVTIAEIDTGVNAALPELAGKILPGKDFGDAGGGDGRTDRDQDPFGHGTAMASIMVARPTLLDITGLAPDARVLPIAVPIQGTSDASVSDHVPDAIRWAVDQHAKVISMSLGGRRDPVQDTVPCPPDEQSAIDYAVARGAIVVAAGGNSGLSGSP